jgi:hypothetical protein
VSDEQVIAQAIEALSAGPLHSHLVSEQPKIVLELYDHFAKFSKSEIQHFHKLEQQQKVVKPDEAPRVHYGDSHHNYLKPVHNIGSNGGGLLESWIKNYRGPLQQTNSGTFYQWSPQGSQRGGASNRGCGHGRGPYTPRPLYCMYHGNETDHKTKDCPIYIDTKQKMNQDTTQPLPQLQPREVNHTMQWALHNQQHSPSYPPHYPTQAYQNSHTQSRAYYQPYHYTNTNHPQPLPTPQITYHPTLQQITYPT